MSWRASAGRRAAPLALLLLGAALAVAALAASSSGAVRIPLGELPSLLWGQPAPGNELWRNVLIDIRLPRVLFALVAGAALAVSGASMQALFRNPLAEPGLIGISAGGALGAVGAIVLTSGGFWILAPAAFAGSLLADMGDKHCMVLRNHGLLTVGRNCPDAFMRLYYLERACTFQVKALSAGIENLNLPNQGMPEHTADLVQWAFDGGTGKLSWPALLRKLDRENPGYDA